MQVILLAAGQSKRLEPLGDKNLLEFCGKPLIEHQIVALKNAKIRDIVIVGNAGNLEGLKRVAKNYQNVVVTEQKEDLGSMAAGVLTGARRVTQDSILVMSTNDIVEPSAFELIKEGMKDKECDAWMLAKKVNEYFPGGYLKINKRGLVEEVIEKPTQGKEPSKFINLVIHAFNDFPAFKQVLEKQGGKAEGRYEAALNHYIKKGKSKLRAIEYKGYWQPIKYPWHVLLAMQRFLEGQKHFIDKTAAISKHAVIKGEPVYIGKNVRVLEHATICGPAYLAEGVVVANNALVRGSMVGKNAVVGYATEIARSYLGSDVWTHSNYVGDSVIDKNVSLGGGTVTGNLRLDEGVISVFTGKEKTSSGLTKFGAVIGQGCRVGINVSLMPGIKVGKNSFVGGGTIIAENIPDSSFVLAQQKIKVTKNKRIAAPDQRVALKKKI